MSISRVSGKRREGRTKEAFSRRRGPFDEDLSTRRDAPDEEGFSLMRRERPDEEKGTRRSEKDDAVGPTSRFALTREISGTVCLMPVSLFLLEYHLVPACFVLCTDI